jgi:septal ring factor EnvC (AmiA/AmiB activator)
VLSTLLQEQHTLSHHLKEIDQRRQILRSQLQSLDHEHDGLSSQLVAVNNRIQEAEQQCEQQKRIMGCVEQSKALFTDLSAALQTLRAFPKVDIQSEEESVTNTDAPMKAFLDYLHVEKNCVFFLCNRILQSRKTLEERAKELSVYQGLNMKVREYIYWVGF